MEARSGEILSGLEPDRPATLRIDFYDRGEDAVQLFEKQGYRVAVAEDEMRRDLRDPLAAVQLPEGMTLVNWGPQSATLFFQAYDDAFEERLGFPRWSEETWRHNLTDYPDFRPDFSLLAVEGTEPVGFTICHADDEEEAQPGGIGWISQMGVRPAWRRRGVGGALLSEVMRRFQAGGLQWAELDVRPENHRAQRLYRRLGFERFRTRRSYQKPATLS
jgi:ribosomal protein S18 acetylase RimI-like enzyme